MGQKKRTKKIGPSGGLGVKYGVSVRKSHNKIITEVRQSHMCPNCGFKRVRRESVGIWACRKCGFKFTGGAYTPTTKLGITAERIAKSS